MSPRGKGLLDSNTIFQTQHCNKKYNLNQQIEALLVSICVGILALIQMQNQVVTLIYVQQKWDHYD